mmetsp:Transcript_61754/g.177792  ORF Transcript_61754/g.177792 Transcript_61754/m.177792 type:complete len:339 (+) Transcript_61754:85-1101(+)
MCIVGLSNFAATGQARTWERDAQGFDAAVRAAKGSVSTDRGFPEVQPAASQSTTAPKSASSGILQLRDTKQNLAEHEILPELTVAKSHTLDKTQLCRFFGKGRCRLGKNCSYAHGKQQLRAKPNLWRTQFCKEFVETGLCRYGERCRFAHRPEEVRAFEDTATASTGELKTMRGESRSEERSAEDIARELYLARQKVLFLQTQVLVAQASEKAPPNLLAHAVAMGGSLQRSAGSAGRHMPLVDHGVIASASCAGVAKRVRSPSPASRRTSVSSASWESDRTNIGGHIGEAGSDTATSSDEEFTVDYVMAVRRTFVDLVPISEPTALRRRTKSLPPGSG